LPDDTREQVLLAAAELLAESGLESMKARAIADRAGLSVGSIYKLFGEIDDLVREVNLQTYRMFAEHHRTALELVSTSVTSPFDRLMVLARAYVDFVINNELRWMALLAFNARQTRPGSKDERSIRAELYAIVETVMSEIPGFTSEMASKKMTRALWAAVHGIVIFTLPNSTSDDPVGETLEQIEMIVGAVVRDASQ